jgi:hypothetical protein
MTEALPYLGLWFCLIIRRLGPARAKPNSLGLISWVSFLNPTYNLMTVNYCKLSRDKFNLRTLTPGSPKMPKNLPSVFLGIRIST